MKLKNKLMGCRIFIVVLIAILVSVGFSGVVSSAENRTPEDSEVYISDSLKGLIE